MIITTIILSVIALFIFRKGSFSQKVSIFILNLKKLFIKQP